MKQIFLSFWGIALAVFTLFLFWIFRAFPNLCEMVYGKLLYPAFQMIRQYFGDFGWIILLLLFVTLIILLKRSTQTFVKHWQRWVFGSLNALGFFMSCFYWMWGFNYARPSLAERMELNMSIKPDSTYVFQEFEESVHTLNLLKSSKELRHAQYEIIQFSESDARKKIHQRTKSFLGSYYHIPFRGIVQELKPKGLLLRFSTLGLYMPFIGSAFIDDGLPEISKPSTFAHEMGHVMGVTNEGECNFIALKVCESIDDVFIRYSGEMSYYSYTAEAAYRTDSLRFKEIQNRLDSAVIVDMKARRAQLNSYPDLFPKWRDIFYDNYLKTQGVKGGIVNYGQVYELEYAYKMKESKMLDIQ